MIENRDEHVWCLPSVSLPSNATPCMLGSPTLATCRCRAATVFTYLLTYSTASDSLPRLVMMMAAAGRRVVVISVLLAAVPAAVLPIVGR